VSGPEVDAILDRFDRFAGRHRTVEVLAGGLTNTNYRVTTDDAVSVVRVSTPDASLLAIDRDHEELNARAAARAGVAPEVYERLTDPPVLVVDYIESETLTAAAVSRGDRLDRIADALRTLHAGPLFANRFDMFEIQRRYLAICSDRGLALPPRYLEHSVTLDRIAAALAARPEALVPCHNDLLAENLLDDGQRIWIIDYEYAGNNEPSFELGNLAAESGLTTQQLADLCAAYWGRTSTADVARAELWGLVARYGWTLWAHISADINPLDFDFIAWGREKYDAFETVTGSPRFGSLLDQAAG